MLCGLIGKKLSHSYSAIIHKELGNYKYELFSLSEQELEPFLQRRDFDGINVTIPYKKAVIPYCDSLDETASRTGSVNTIVKDSGGRLCGYNTDYFGFLSMCRSIGLCFEGKKVLILGSGGTSATVFAAASENGAREIVTISRTGEENYGNVSRHRDCDIIINTTPVGMYPNNGEYLIELNEFPGCTGVVDVIYNPLRTRLILSAQELAQTQGDGSSVLSSALSTQMNRPLMYSGGLTMLVAQAVYSAQLFANEKLESSHDTIEIMDGLIKKQCDVLLKKICNVVLIGMPGSGKTSIGLRVAELLDREFIDTDTLISKRAGMSIPEIFSRYGEAHFRSIEADIIAENCKLSGKVIATGGGAVLSKENRMNIHQNGLVVQIDRNIEELESCGRPLSQNLDVLRQMVLARKPLYDACSNVTVQNKSSVDDAARRIEEVLNAYTCD